MQLKEKFHKLRGVDSQKMGKARRDYLGYDLYPEEDEGVQDQTFRWRAPLRDSSSASIHPRLFWSPK